MTIGESTPKEANTVLSTGKVMAAVFWNIQGTIRIDFLERVKTIKQVYYAALDRLKNEMKAKFFFHTSTLGFELVPQPYIFSGLVSPCDFFLFQKLKINSTGV